MWSGFWFHTSMQSSKNRYIPYNLGLKIVNNKTIWYVTTLFSISSHLFTGKPTMTSSCLPAKWRRRHRACILSCYHYWNQKHWPTLTNHRKAMEMKTNKTKLLQCGLLFGDELAKITMYVTSLWNSHHDRPLKQCYTLNKSPNRSLSKVTFLKVHNL